jgi:integrase
MKSTHTPTAPRAYDWSKIPNLELRGPRRICHARVEVNGREHTRSLHIEADPAGLNAPFVIEALRAFKLKLAQDSFEILKLTRSRNEHSTCLELFNAFEKACAGRDIKDETVSSAISRCRHVLRTVHGEGLDVDTARTSLFTADLAQSFESEKIAAVKSAAKAAAAAGAPWSPELLEKRIRSAGNSAKSCLQQARQIFAERVLRSVAYRALVLPDLAAFMAYRIEGTTLARYVPPPAETWRQILADLPALRTERPALWIAFQLGVNCGLRRSSARNARWDWCIEQPDGRAILDVRRAKGGNHTITIDAAVWRDLQALRSTVDYIIPGQHETPAARAAAIRANPPPPTADDAPTPALEPSRDEVIDELVAWLRARGLTQDIAEKPFHLLRKIFGDTMRSTHGLDEAQKNLGHSSSQLTHQVYSSHAGTKSVRIA